MNAYVQNLKQPSLFQAVLESLIDGILILTEQGEWVHANERARRICQQLTKGISHAEKVPQEIWRACESLIGSRELLPDQLVAIEDEIIIDQAIALRVRAQWLDLEEFENSCLLVTLEDRRQSIRDMAMTDAQRFGLTERELEVWLHYLSHESHQAISSKLHITRNTVKKHMKNIHAKRRAVLEEFSESSA